MGSHSHHKRLVVAVIRSVQIADERMGIGQVSRQGVIRVPKAGGGCAVSSLTGRQSQAVSRPVGIESGLWRSQENDPFPLPHHPTVGGTRRNFSSIFPAKG